MNPPGLLALDFDGVISDSAPEAFVVALRTWQALEPDSVLAPHARPLMGGAAPSPASVRTHALYAAFLALMPLGNRAEDYGVTFEALRRDAPVSDQDRYDAFKRSLDPGWLDAYHARFYLERDALASGDPEGWHGLMAPYAAFVDLLRRREGDALLAIATAKDRASVDRLLVAYGASDLFAPDRILDKETGKSKRAHLRTLAERTGLPFAEMLFVDDKVNHLEGVASLGVRCGLAGWGYNGEREALRARQRGHAVLELETVEEQLYGGSGARSAGVD
jgi:phosphoglycolate phosphatase-like HAD superfamily hydrolase